MAKTRKRKNQIERFTTITFSDCDIVDFNSTSGIIKIAGIEDNRYKEMTIKIENCKGENSKVSQQIMEIFWNTIEHPRVDYLEMSDLWWDAYDKMYKAILVEIR